MDTEQARHPARHFVRHVIELEMALMLPTMTGVMVYGLDDYTRAHPARRPAVPPVGVAGLRR